ncbi:MAG: glycoside hydrolase family 2 TIM barrel-domain containing protein [Caldilineaceae bacterium]
MSARTRFALDGRWQFQHDPTAGNEVSAITEWREAQVPMPWQAQFADLRHRSGVGWYRRSFTLAEQPDENANAAILHFGAVDYHGTVWINGHRAANMKGLSAFAFDVTTLLRAGENELVVRVADPTDDAEQWPTFTFSEIPHGKQSWYGPISGIWQRVWLELRPGVHLSDIKLTPDPASSSIAAKLTLNMELPAGWEIRSRLTGPDGAVVPTTQQCRDGVVDEQRLTLPTTPLLWSPAHPHLYTVTVGLYAENRLCDELSATCGFRTVEAKAGRIYLNGEPIYLRGALDQAYYPETIYTPPSLEYLEAQVYKAKALGLNCLRCHIKIEDPRYYEVADRLGILVWTEIPNWIHLSAGASQRAKETFVRMVERDWNHPSIIAWTLINEDWGTDLARNPEHRIWLAGFYHEAKQIDPYRLIVDNSACDGNLHVAGDLDDFHQYRAIPDHAQEWDDWVADFAGRPAWAWAEDFAHERRADLPLIVSEFGNWGLPHPDAILEGGNDPWWFENGLEWGDGIVYPHGMRERFAYWGLDKVFGDLERFTQAHQEHMAQPGL